MADFLGDAMALDGGQPAIDDDVKFASLSVAEPAQGNVVRRQHARYGAGCRFDQFHRRRIDGIHHPPPHIAGRAPNHYQNRKADPEADQWVGERKAQPTPMAPASTPSEVKPSAHACRPSATNAAEPISRPTRMRKIATSSLPRKPMAAAAATQPKLHSGCG